MLITITATQFVIGVAVTFLAGALFGIFKCVK